MALLFSKSIDPLGASLVGFLDNISQDRRNSGRGWWWSLASDIADYTIQPHTGKHNHKEFEETIDMFGDRLECQGLQIHNKKISGK